MPKIELSIITISYNTRQILLDCLSSILKYTKGLDYEIIVVDNGSTDGSLAMIKDLAQKHPQVKLVDAKKNLGFGRGNNLGAKKATGDYLLFLNSDTLIFDNAIQDSLEILKKQTKTGVYSCRLLNADRSFQPSGGHFPTLGRVFSWQFFLDDLPFVGNWFVSIHPHEPGFNFLHRLYKPQKVSKLTETAEKYPDWVTGAFFLIKKDIFGQVGGFDEKIFMYTEEMELCFRLAKLGYKTYYTNTPAIIHLGKASGSSYLAFTEEIKNMLYFWQKHLPAWQLPLVKLFFWLGSLLRLLIFGIIKGDAKARRAYYDALGFIF